MPYSPADLAAALAAGFPIALAWTGAGIGGGIVLMFAFIGIRKGFEFFRGLGDGGAANRSSFEAWQAARDEAKYRDDSW